MTMFILNTLTLRHPSLLPKQTLIKVIQTKIEIRAHSSVGKKEAANKGGPELAYGEPLDGDKDRDAVSKTYSMFVGFFSLQRLTDMVNTMTVVPMLCILMIFARVRASSDLHTSPQAYARGFFITSALAIYIQVHVYTLKMNILKMNMFILKSEHILY